jgi:hypothetical protein
MNSPKAFSKPDNNAVKLAATTLILASGCTTTLEVKLHLRKQGFQALQKDISKKMREVALKEGWVHIDNGQFFIYTFPQIGISPQ